MASQQNAKSTVHELQSDFQTIQSLLNEAQENLDKWINQQNSLQKYQAQVNAQNRNNNKANDNFKNKGNYLQTSGLFNKNVFDDSLETTNQQQQSFFSQDSSSRFFSPIPLLNVDESTQNKINSLLLNSVSSRRKDELFKRYKKDQQQAMILRKREVQRQEGPLSDFPRNLKGQYILKRSSQSSQTAVTHTCSINSQDLEKLRPQADLNDTIIANYMKYLQTEVLSQEVEKNTFIYSTFFISKLLGQHVREDLQPYFPIPNTKEQRIHTERIKKQVQENYKKIERWTRKIDIFAKKYLVIPINAFKHWYCVILVNPGMLLSQSEATQKLASSQSGKNKNRPYIVNCDSMFEKKGFIIEAVRKYLQIELQKKNKSQKITEQRMPCYQLLLPRQTNTHDCGMYMMAYIEHLLKNPSELDNLHIVQNRKKLNLFPRRLILTMRERLKNFFIQMVKVAGKEQQRNACVKRYHQQTQRIIQKAKQQQKEKLQSLTGANGNTTSPKTIATAEFDQINMREFKKYYAMNYHLFEGDTQTNQQQQSQLSEQQKQFICMVKFYLDTEINYYERDRQQQQQMFYYG